MSNKTRKTLRMILFAVGIISSALLFRQLNENRQSDNRYKDARNIAYGDGAGQGTAATEDQWIPRPVEDDANFETLSKIDLAALRENNRDVVGWIFLPGTQINYPILQGDDNEYYLENNWNKVKSDYGSIFMECRNNGDFSDFNTIIYGHNMFTNAMFSQLRQYEKPAFWEKAPYIYIVCDKGIYRYEVFAAYRTPVESATYGLSFNQDSTKADFLMYCEKSSEVESGIVPSLTDRIITLSTCTAYYADNRWVVQGRMEMVKNTD